MGAKQFFGGQCWRFKLINSFHVDLGCGDARGPFRISPRVRKYDTNRNFMHVFFGKNNIKITIHFCIKISISLQKCVPFNRGEPNPYSFSTAHPFFPERLGEGRFLGAVSLSSLTWLAWFKLLNLNLLDLTCLTWTCLTKTFLTWLSWLDLGKLLTWSA